MFSVKNHKNDFYKIIGQLQPKIYVCCTYPTDIKISVLESLKRVDAYKTLQNANILSGHGDMAQNINS